MAEILICYGFEYSGHHAAARALAEACERAIPDARVHLLNYFKHTAGLWEKISTEAFYTMLKYLPGVWNSLYWSDRTGNRLASFRKVIQLVSRRGVGEVLEEYKPDLILCTQAFACGMLSDHAANGGSVPHVGAVLTDYYVPSYWWYPDIDIYFVSHREARDSLVARGIEPNRIYAEGIPVSPRFSDPIEKDEARRRLGLSEGRFGVLISGGGGGWGQLERLADAVCSHFPEFLVIVAAGRNTARYRRLLKRSRLYGQRRLVAYPYVERMDLLLRAADVMISKAGGISIAEALAVTLPVILFDPLPGQEGGNMDFVRRKRIGHVAGNIDDVVNALSGMSSSPQWRKEMRERAFQYGNPEAACTIIRKAIDYCGLS